jgi:hypothetical protein
METTNINFEHWAIIEVFGHEKYSGKITTEKVGATEMYRLDIPETEEQPEFVKFINPSSVFSITPVEEAYAKEYANRLSKPPIKGYEHTEVIKALAKKAMKKMTMDQVKKLAMGMSEESPELDF